jgi:DNA-binding response OmpR family regulator
MAPGDIAHVLVVDDEPDLRELLVDALSDRDVEVLPAANGEEAVRIAERNRPDLVIADLFLGDDSGLNVIDRLRKDRDDLPAVVITGSREIESFSMASRRHPVEMMTKPLDLERLRETIRATLDRVGKDRRQSRRVQRVTRLARDLSAERKVMRRHIDDTCEGMAAAYRNLSGQLAMQREVLSFQNQLIGARNDDDVFRTLFRVFVRRTGPVFGAALVCDAHAQLQVVGRFGVPYPDPLAFCRSLADPLVDAILDTPDVMLLDTGDEAEMFDESIRRFLPGLTALVIPLIPAPGELIGLVTLYRKGEQPFTDADVALAELLATPCAIAVRRND